MLFRILFSFQFGLLLIIKQFKKVEQLCLERIAKNPSERLPQTLLGYFYFKLGEYNQAATQYRILLDKDPSDFIDHYNLIRTLFKAERYEEVIQIGSKCLEQDFKNLQCTISKSLISHLHWYIAQAATKTQRYEVSINYFEKYLPFSKKHRKEVYESLGYCYERLGNYEKAVRNYKKALSIDPTLSVSRHNLEQIHKRNKN